ncbi:MAG: alpha/beta fold hydrolase [Flavobacteriia bacterium]|jgi:pimeloyl-ACP methyl ester carboxylesterase
MSSSFHIVSNADLKLEYFTYGSGQEIIICLHGHGRSASDFEFIAGENRRVISIHLFHHGNSYFPIERIEKKPLFTIEFIELFQLILERETVSQFHLFAFSQGGRFSLCLIPYFAAKIKTITLIAPDGMDNHSFYNWSSRQRWARNVFRYFEKDPSRLSMYSEIARRIGIMRPKVASFVAEFSSDKDSFIRASRTWRTFRFVEPDYKSLNQALNKNNIPFLIIMGIYDQVIRPKQAYKFARLIGKENNVVEIPNGHNFFKSTSINKFIHLLPFMEHSLSLNQIIIGNEQHP